MEENEIKKVLKTGKAMMITTIVFLIITLGLIGGAFYLNYQNTNNPEDLGELIENYQDTEGKYAKINLSYLPYGFAEEEGSTRYYYFAMDSDNFMYVVRLTEKTYEELEKLSNNGNDTFDYEIKGYTFNLSTKLKQLAVQAANEAFENATFTYSNITDYIGNVYIDETETPDDDMSVGLFGMSILSGMFLIVFGIAFISQVLRTRKVTGNKELMEELRNELEGLTDNPYKKQKVYLTTKYLISKVGGLTAIEYRDIIWVYSQIRYVNGIAQGKTLMVCTKDKKKYGLVATGANDASVEEIMVEIKDKNENVRIGFTKENREFFRNYHKENI